MAYDFETGDATSIVIPGSSFSPVIKNLSGQTLMASLNGVDYFGWRYSVLSPFVGDEGTVEHLEALDRYLLKPDCGQKYWAVVDRRVATLLEPTHGYWNLVYWDGAFYRLFGKRFDIFRHAGLRIRRPTHEEWHGTPGEPGLKDQDFADTP